ncbi:unnamed protein product [Nippostrongylus brasiliensis]|uniref:Col_cuticle_N domain-containing protein n=1 Tax=Nippostrongylus brasiliensis TaxID=27835 RepID=A0A0N4YET9_NIPBR|nr:unnamed protein product [Nippostrongylus brasiliensis]
MRGAPLITPVLVSAAVAPLISAMLMLPWLYWEMVDLQYEVRQAVESFKVATDSSWDELMKLQTSQHLTSKPKENPFLRREKRFSSLPDWCYCDATPICPPGPPGRPGPPGTPGSEQLCC